MRSFLAVEVPQGIRASLEGIQRELRQSGADVRWVRPESIHLTLKFLGEIDEERVEEIRSVLTSVVSGHEPFEVQVNGVGCFPGLRQPRVVWVGLFDRGNALSQLHKEIDQAMSSLGFEREDRPFRPHLTLGRVKSARGRQAMLERMKDLLNVDLGTFRVESITLFRSDLHPSGARYTPIWEAALGVPEVHRT